MSDTDWPCLHGSRNSPLSFRRKCPYCGHASDSHGAGCRDCFTAYLAVNPHPPVTPGRAPCAQGGFLQWYDSLGPCRACGHMAMIHGPGGVCDVCTVVEMQPSPRRWWRP